MENNPPSLSTEYVWIARVWSAEKFLLNREIAHKDYHVGPFLCADAILKVIRKAGLKFMGHAGSGLQDDPHMRIYQDENGVTFYSEIVLGRVERY